MKKPNILLDMDGVLASFTKGAIDAMNRFTGSEYTIEYYAKNHPYWEMFKLYDLSVDEMWDAVEKTPNFWYDLDLFPWANDLYRELCGIGDVTIVTAPPHYRCPDAAMQKMVWLRNKMGISQKDVFVGSKKYLMAGNGILIDDYSGNVDKFKNAGGDAILIPSDWNTVDLTYEKVLDAITEPLSHLI